MSTDQINNPISDINSRVEGDAGGSIIITGAAGFIGSCMVQYLNENGYEKLILVDDFGVEEKRKNWESKISLDCPFKPAQAFANMHEFYIAV